MSGNASAELIRASGLFDPEFYRRTYGHWIGEGEDPLRHFLEVGMEQGYLPSADFDPVLYKVLVPECGADNPLVHCAASGVPFRPRQLREVFPAVTAAMSFRGNPRDLDIQPNRAFAGAAATAKDIPLVADGHRYVLKVPEPGVFLERLRADRPFAFVRLPHGFWDALWLLEVAETGLAEDRRSCSLPSAHLRALAMRLCASARAIHGGFAPFFIEEVLADIPVHAAHPDFFRGISFKGYPTHEEDVFGGRGVPPPEALGRIVARHFRPDETLYDGTLWKRLLIAGHLQELPALCRGRPVVLVASKPFADLDERWQLEDFTHVEIPFTLTQWQRWDLLARTSKAVAAACARSSRPPVVLTRCGASLAWWLITRLFTQYPRVFYLELGQALGGWFFDVLDLLGAPWAKVYASSIIANCHLESYYRGRLGARYDDWIATLSDPGLALAAQSNAGGSMKTDIEKHQIPGPRLDDLVEAIKTRQPGLFDTDVTDDTAGALLRQAFEIIRERLSDAQEGEMQIEGLGTFRIRNVERGEGAAQIRRKVINLKIN